jgi:hypothetical protein
MDYIIGGAGVDYEIVQPSPSTSSFIGNLPDERSVYFVMMLKGLIDKTSFVTMSDKDRSFYIETIAKSADLCVRALNNYRVN